MIDGGETLAMSVENMRKLERTVKNENQFYPINWLQNSIKDMI